MAAAVRHLLTGARREEGRLVPAGAEDAAQGGRQVAMQLRRHLLRQYVVVQLLEERHGDAGMPAQMRQDRGTALAAREQDDGMAHWP
ncbi:MAG: hypothetical protein IRY87_28255 [Acetobacteraceae bacterium]|nr:hypothetical protein [Acetobacteraceae bacterium]